MASNTDRPNGLRPIRMLDGSPYNAQVMSWPVDASNGTAIFKGDLVVLEDDGNIAPSGAGGAVLGVCVGVTVDRAVSATEHPGYLPASTAGNVDVELGRNVVFEIQEDSAGGAMVAANVGSNGDVVAGTGSATTGRSAYELDSSDVIASDASAKTAQLRVLKLSSRQDNEIGVNAKWEVIINEHQFTDSNIGL